MFVQLAECQMLKTVVVILCDCDDMTVDKNVINSGEEN